MDHGATSEEVPALVGLGRSRNCSIQATKTPRTRLPPQRELCASISTDPGTARTYQSDRDVTEDKSHRSYLIGLAYVKLSEDR